MRLASKVLNELFVSRNSLLDFYYFYYYSNHFNTIMRVRTTIKKFYWRLFIFGLSQNIYANNILFNSELFNFVYFVKELLIVLLVKNFRITFV